MNSISTFNTLGYKTKPPPRIVLICDLLFTSGGAVDSKGNALRVVGTPSFVVDTTRIGSGVYIMSTNGSSSIEYINSVLVSSSYTITLWIKGWTSGVVVGGSYGAGIWYIYVNGGYFDFGSNQGECRTTASLASLAGTGWNHWAVVRDNNSLTGKIYLNGSLISSIVLQSFKNVSPSSWTIGCGNANGYNNAANSGARFESFKLFNGAMTVDEIITEYNLPHP